MDFTTKQLDEIWTAQEDERAKIIKRRRYYEGKHDIVGRNAKYADGKRRAEIPTNFCEHVVDMYVGACTAMPWQLTPNEDGNQSTDEYTEIAQDTALSAVDVENLRNTLIAGYALEVYEYQDGKPRVIPEAPENWALVRNENDEIVAAMTRFTLPKFRVFRGEMLTTDTEIMYLYDERKRAGWMRKVQPGSQIKSNWEEFENAPHQFGFVPVVEWRANEERRSLLTDAFLAQNDEYNDIDSLSGDDIRNVADALLKIKGIDSSWVKANETAITQARILPLPDDADAEYLIKTTDTGRVSERLARTREAMHIMAAVPDIQQIVGVTGGTSGIALQLKFMPMQQRADAMFKELEKCLRQRVDVFNTLRGKTGRGLIEDYRVVMNFSMPVNRIEEWQNIGSLQGIVSQRTMLELLTDIDNPEGELDRLSQDQQTQADIRTFSESPETQAARQDVAVQQAANSFDGPVQRLLDILSDRALAATIPRLPNGAAN